MLQKTGADAASCPLEIGGELAEKQAGNRIGRLARAHRARQERRNHRSGGQAIISDDASGLMDDYDGGEALLLIGESPGLQPVIECRLAAGEFRDVMCCGNRFRR